MWWFLKKLNRIGSVAMNSMFADEISAVVIIGIIFMVIMADNSEKETEKKMKEDYLLKHMLSLVACLKK